MSGWASLTTLPSPCTALGPHALPSQAVAPTAQTPRQPSLSEVPQSAAFSNNSLTLAASLLTAFLETHWYVFGLCSNILQK